MKAGGKREAQRNASPLVTKKYFEQSTESAKYQRQLLRSFRASRLLFDLTRGDAPHVVRRLPLAIIFRAFGAHRSSGPLVLIRPLALIALWRSSRFGAHRALALIALWRSSRFGAHRALALIALWRSSRFGAHRALALIALWRSSRFGAHRAL